jgi:hypothetical protein
MFSPERLNVLLSRARNSIVMVGNATTFTNARKGQALWQELLQLLRSGNHVYEGFPVTCNQHPSRTEMLRVPIDFDVKCPDGGCSDPWLVGFIFYAWAVVLIMESPAVYNSLVGSTLALRNAIRHRFSTIPKYLAPR